jgi:hypothetical protein
MSDILFHYHRVNPTTWFYFASLLSIALFFKFNRLWSIRNLDLLGLILLAPGILAVEYGGYKANLADQQLGFVWVFVVTGWFLARMLHSRLNLKNSAIESSEAK